MRFWSENRATSRIAAGGGNASRRIEPNFNQTATEHDLSVAAEAPRPSAEPSGLPARGNAEVATFAEYFAKQIMARKGLQAGVPVEARAIAEASDIVLSGTYGLVFTIVAIVDRDAHPGKSFELGRDALEAIGLACLKYSMAVNRRKMPVVIQVYEVGSGSLNPERTDRLKKLRRSSLFSKVAMSGWTIDPSSSSVWTNAPFNGRLAGRPYIEKLLRSPREEVTQARPAPLTPTPVVPLLTYAMLAVLVGVYICELVFGVSPMKGMDTGVQTLIALGGNSRALIELGQWYRLLSAALLHINPFHLVMNGICLFIAGTILETLVGRSWLAVIFIIGALGGSVASLLINPPNIVSVGASGAIMALFAAIYTLSLHFDAGRERTLLQTRAVGVLIPSLIPLGASIAGGRVDYGAHLGGAVAGALLGLALLRAWPRTEVLPRFRIGAAVLAWGGAIAFGAALFAITQNYQKFARGTELIPPDQMPKTDAEIPGRSKDLLARYPRDPRAHFFQAIALLRGGDAASGELELRAALAEEDTIQLLLSREFEMRVRGLLAIVLAGQGRTAEAKSEAKPACGSTDTAPQIRGLMDKGHLCD